MSDEQALQTPREENKPTPKQGNRSQADGRDTSKNGNNIMKESVNRREGGPQPKQQQGEAEETSTIKKGKRHPHIDAADTSTKREGEATSRPDTEYKTRGRDAQDWREAKDKTGRPRRDRRRAAEPEEDWKSPKGTKEDAGKPHGKFLKAQKR